MLFEPAYYLYISESGIQGPLVTYIHMSSTTHRKLSLVLVENGNRIGNLVRVGRLENAERLQICFLVPVVRGLSCVVCRVSSEEEVWVQGGQLSASALSA